MLENPQWTERPKLADEVDLRATLQAVAEIKSVTIFHEPINIRAESVERIEAQGRTLGLLSLSSSNEERAGVRSRNLVLRTDVFESRDRWQDYTVTALQTVERLATEICIAGRLHLWPDKSLATSA